MALGPGTRLGPYEVVAPLGTGGMGEVYRARDTRLERTVAIKILPAQFSSDPVHKQRFEREAKSVSSLNHPNICVLYDVGHQDGMDYLVMECIEGETLAKRLERGALPTEQVLKIGTEIADGLDKAHRSGVVHRDLKPGNIMLTKTGAKLLDFGLAKPVVSISGAITLTAAAGTSPVTEQGMIVGTFQYMSPEQVEGKEIKGRSDIFSLGAVLYEMLTGKRAFEGTSQLSVASAILEKEPRPISTLKPLSPRSLEHVIRRCLAKDPDDRWQSARDLALELKSISSGDLDSSSANFPLLPRSRFSRQLFPWTIAVLSLLAALFLLVRTRSGQPAQSDPIKVSISPPDKTELNPTGPVSISPDGKLMVFAASVPGFGGQLWLRRLDSLTQTALPGTDVAENPFWSPDSRWIAFTSESKLKKISVDGGTPIEICEGGSNRGGTWSPSGTILFVPGLGVPVFAVSANGGTPAPVIQLDKSLKELTLRWPQFLPDGKHFLFFSRGPKNVTYAGSLGSTDRKLILTNDTNVIYAPPGYLLFQRNGTLMAQPFDADRLELSGAPVTIAEEVATYGTWQHALFSASGNGRLAFQSRRERLTQPVWTDLSGKDLEPIGDPAEFEESESAVSPDGQKIAFVINDPRENSMNIWIYDVRRHLRSRLTFEPISAGSPVWSHDSNRILFGSNRLGRTNTFSIDANGMGQAQLLFASDGGGDYPSSWSADGRFIALWRNPNGEQGKLTIWIYPTFGEKNLYPLLPTSQSNQWGAVFSPDGRWLAFQTDESGGSEVYVVPFPEAKSRIQVSKNGGWNPQWSRDGKKLFYDSTGGPLMVASLLPGKNILDVGETRSLFNPELPGFRLSPIDDRILVFRQGAGLKPSTINLISNWPSLLPRK